MGRRSALPGTYLGRASLAFAQVTAEEIFLSLACVSESFVFMCVSGNLRSLYTRAHDYYPPPAHIWLVHRYMGMGFFTGRFHRWDPVFIPAAIVFCLLGRLLNTFPLSWISNLTRKTKIPFRMQVNTHLMRWG